MPEQVRLNGNSPKIVDVNLLPKLGGCDMIEASRAGFDEMIVKKWFGPRVGNRMWAAKSEMTNDTQSER